MQKLDHAEPVDLLALAAEEGARYGVEVTGASATLSGDRKLLDPPGAQPDAECAAPRRASGHRGNRKGRLVNPPARQRPRPRGIPDAEQERVFEPFYRPAGRAESAGSWGLGLALVRQIATHHGATVRYEARPQGGACFVVEFPV